MLTAKADGFEYAKRLDRKEDVPTVLAEFLSFEGPAFLEVIIDQEASASTPWWVWANRTTT